MVEKHCEKRRNCLLQAIPSFLTIFSTAIYLQHVKISPSFFTGSELNSFRHYSVCSVADLRTGGHWFDPRLGQYSFRGFMIVIATGFIPLSTLSVVSTMFMWESSQWLGKNIMQSTGQKNSRKARIGALASTI